MKTIPPHVAQEVIRQQVDLNWPESVPKYVEIPNADGEVLFHLYEDLGPIEFEQATEYHIREAVKRLERKRGRPNVIAALILRARIYRCKYLSLMGIDETSEDDMPFSNGHYEEVR